MMKIGILGTGFGAYHASIYSKLANIDSVKIFGRNNDKLDKLKKDMGIEVTSNIYDILDDRDIDLIDVCLPSAYHREYVVQALKKGKNVFCETPVSLTIEDASAMLAAEKHYGNRVFVNQFIKMEHPYVYLYETVQKGSIGKLKALHIRRKTPPLWGHLGLDNITTNLMIHELDLISSLFGLPDEISAVGVNGKEGESHVDALLFYKDSVVEVQSSSMMPLSHAFTVGYEAVFEQGTIEYFENGYADKCEKSLILFTKDSKDEIKILEGNCYEESIKHVITCCKKNLPTRLGLEDAVKALNVALQIKEKIMRY